MLQAREPISAPVVKKPSPLILVIAVAIAVAGLALASQAEIPIQPVPITLQTLAVVLIGFLFGARIGAVAILLWLIAGAAGLPFFAGGESGVSHLTGPTAGYLLSFPFAAAVASIGLSGGNNRRWFIRPLIAALAAHALTLAMGGSWLATKIGLAGAWEHGVLPFIPGAIVKSVAAVLILKLLRPALSQAGYARSR